MFQRAYNKRISVVLIVVIALFLLIIFKVGYIQLVDYKKLNKLATSLWSRNLPIEASRGLISDRNGVVLANNVTTTSLVLIPNQIVDKEDTSKKLAEILGVTYDEMYKHVSKKTSIERVHPEGRRLSYEVADKISNLGIKGVYLVKESMRNYVYDKMLSHVLGYVGIDNQGLSGLELEYEDYLTGSEGAIKYFSDAKGSRLKLNEVYVQPQNGINIELTIDYDIQASVERELDNIVTKYQPEQALAVVMNPNTGEILAMSSRPNFSPSNYQDYTIEEINRNLPIWSTYEPGSTFKIITLSAALEEGVVDLLNEHFFDAGGVQVENARIKCWKAGGHGDQTFLQVVENSCNPGFVELGQRLGKERLFSYIAINGGKLYKPYIVKRLVEPETNTIIKENEPTVVRQVISEKTSEMVRFALESVVTNGTGRPAYIDGYRVGGKTGTAQKVSNGAYMVGNYIVSFIGFLPANNPQVVVYVAIDHPKGVTQYGGTVAAPVARTILKDAINALDIKVQEGSTEKKYQWNDVKIATVPNVVGKTKKEAITELKNFQIEYSGSGDYVVEQSPSGGSRIFEGGKVRVMLGNES